MLVGSMQLGIDPHYILTDQQIIVHMLVLVSSLVHLALAIIGKLLFDTDTDGCYNQQLIVSLISLSLYHIYFCRLVEQFWLIPFYCYSYYFTVKVENETHQDPHSQEASQAAGPSYTKSVPSYSRREL